MNELLELRDQWKKWGAIKKERWNRGSFGRMEEKEFEALKKIMNQSEALGWQKVLNLPWISDEDWKEGVVRGEKWAPIVFKREGGGERSVVRQERPIDWLWHEGGWEVLSWMFNNPLYQNREMTLSAPKGLRRILECKSDEDWIQSVIEYEDQRWKKEVKSEGKEKTFAGLTRSQWFNWVRDPMRIKASSLWDHDRAVLGQWEVHEWLWDETLEIQPEQQSRACRADTYFRVNGLITSETSLTWDSKQESSWDEDDWDAHGQWLQNASMKWWEKRWKWGWYKEEETMTRLSRWVEESHGNPGLCEEKRRLWGKVKSEWMAKTWKKDLENQEELNSESRGWSSHSKVRRI